MESLSLPALRRLGLEHEFPSILYYLQRCQNWQMQRLGLQFETGGAAPPMELLMASRLAITMLLSHYAKVFAATFHDPMDLYCNCVAFSSLIESPN